VSQSHPSERRANDRVGPYRLVQPLGRGGMAEVWTARDSRLKPAPLVVVKCILPQLAEEPGFVTMLRTEAAVMARLEHPDIPRLRDSGDDGGLPYLVIDLVDGLELARVRDKLRALGPMPVAPAVWVARALARTLDYLHKLERGLVHRDVSPSNVILAFDGSVKLLDFGIAKALSSASDDVKTRTGVLKGKLGYLSPEQVDGEELDARSDQFSLGVVLHELLTGARLFVGESAPRLLLQVRAAKVKPPSLANASVPPELDRVCLRALARARDERFSDCGALAAALDPIVAELGWDVARQRELLAQLDLEPTISRSDIRVTPTPTPTPTVTARPRRRGQAPRWPWLVVALVLTGLGMAIAGALYWWRGQLLPTSPPSVPRAEELPVPAPLPPTPTPTKAPRDKPATQKLPAHNKLPAPSPATEKPAQEKQQTMTRTPAQRRDEEKLQAPMPDAPQRQEKQPQAPRPQEQQQRAPQAAPPSEVADPWSR
jgi:serine/threonine protein kinase